MFKMMSLNVRGLSNFKKRKLIFPWCRKTKSDIICLQETHSKVEVQKQWEREWGGSMFFSHGSNNARGVAILFRSGFDINIDAVKRDGQGRLLVIKGKLEDSAFTTLNIYAPNVDRCSCQFFGNLQGHLLEFGISDEDNIIIGVDFNCPLNPRLDRQGGILVPRANAVRRLANNF